MSATSQYLHLVSATRQKKNRNEYLCWIVSNYWLNSWLIKDLINDVNAWSPKDDVEVISDAKIHNACGGCWNSTNHVHSWKGVLNSARDGILQITWPDRCCVGLHEVLCEMHVGYWRWRLEVTCVAPRRLLQTQITRRGGNGKFSIPFKLKKNQEKRKYGGASYQRIRNSGWTKTSSWRFERSWRLYFPATTRSP